MIRMKDSILEDRKGSRLALFARVSRNAFSLAPIAIAVGCAGCAPGNESQLPAESRTSGIAHLFRTRAASLHSPSSTFFLRRPQDEDPRARMRAADHIKRTSVPFEDEKLGVA